MPRLRKLGKRRSQNENVSNTSGKGTPNVLRSKGLRSIGKSRRSADRGPRNSLSTTSRRRKNGRRGRNRKKWTSLSAKC